MELAALREENAELKRRAGEVTSLETALKKAESRAETLEEKVNLQPVFDSVRALIPCHCKLDGVPHPRASDPERERA